MDHKKTIRHGLEVIATLLMALVLAAPASSSANDIIYVNQVVPLDYTTTNICAPGDIPIDMVGESIIQEKIFTDENGIRSTVGHYSIKATGLDANGIGYTVKGNLNINDKLPEGGSFTQVLIFRMISKGPTDNFYIHNRIHISQDGAVKSEFESVCRG